MNQAKTVKHLDARQRVREAEVAAMEEMKEKLTRRKRGSKGYWERDELNSGVLFRDVNAHNRMIAYTYLRVHIDVGKSTNTNTE